MAGQFRGQGLHRASGKTPRQQEAGICPQGPCHGDQKAQGGAAFAAVQYSFPNGAGAGDGGDGDTVAVGFDPRPQARQTPESGLNVLAACPEDYTGWTIRQGCSNEQPMGGRF